MQLRKVNAICLMVGEEEFLRIAKDLLGKVVGAWGPIGGTFASMCSVTPSLLESGALTAGMPKAWCGRGRHGH